jgi:chlorite dismutase
MGSGCGQGSGSANGSAVATNLAFTKFLFVIARADDDAHGARLRTAGGNIARGFFNDFDIDDARETQSQRFETIQFYVREGEAPESADCPGPCIQKARHMVQVTSKYRPRLQEIDEELRRRIGDSAEILSLEGAFRGPRYSSPEMVNYSNKGAPTRRSGRLSKNAIVVPIRKTPEWWQKSTLERHSYFYPHVDHASATPVKGHALAAEKGIPTLFRRVYHNPDGYERPGEFDFVSYFECDDDSLPVFDQVMTSLRDFHQNPEWRYVEEGPIWRGRRVLRW